MKKKLLVMCCIFTMMTAMLAGCGSKGNISTEISSDTDVTTVTSEATTVDGNITEKAPEPVTEGDFIYEDDTKTHIIGLSEVGRQSMDIVFPETVTVISDVTLPSIEENPMSIKIYFMNPDVKLENVSFGHSSLEVVANLPNMTEIPAAMFNGCTKLTQIGDTANTITIPDGVTAIGAGAFVDCKLIKKVVLPNSVITIDNNAFQGCVALKDFTFSNSLELIGAGSFMGTGLQSVTLPNSVKSIGAICFANNTSLESINITNTEILGQECFTGCTALTTFKANKDFDVVNSETGDSQVFAKLFNGAKVTVNIPDGVYKDWLKANPDSNITVK